MKWNSSLAYAIGLITTDGSLSIDGRHINLTSKDIEQIQLFAKLLGLKNRIGVKRGGYVPQNKYYQIQFGNVKLYRFLQSIGLTPNKTKTIGKLYIPDRYFADFLRGHLDGDGYTYSYWDPRWRSSFSLYTVFVSASKQHLEWIQDRIHNLYKITGRLSFHKESMYNLRFAKKNSLILIRKMYCKSSVPCLKRKHSKIMESLDIINR